jgi:hypothetical protein
MKRLWIAGTLALLMAAGTLGTLPAQASTSGRRNTAIGLGAAAVYELLNGNTTAGIALGAGAAYGYKRYRDEKRYEDRYGYYGRGYGYRSDRYDRDYHPAWHDEYRRGDDRDYRNDRYSRSDRHWVR